MPSWFHLTARMSPVAPDLARDDTGAWLWMQLRAAFPEALAATLMPDHPHLVLPSDDPTAAAQRLARLLGHFGRRFGVWGRVSKVPPPASIRGGEVLARQVRYVALNPCRAALVRCPLAWMWSTHRDVMGATVDPWVTADRLAHALGLHPRAFAARHHAYVSGDPRARIEGTPLPQLAKTTNMPTVALETIAEAAAAATRADVAAIRSRGPTRALFVALAFDQGWNQVARLTELCDCCPRTIGNLRAAVDPLALHAARMCLGDARLRRRHVDARSARSVA
jgi:hypothetical protein